jgi:hypothetical protein
MRKSRGPADNFDFVFARFGTMFLRKSGRRLRKCAAHSGPAAAWCTSSGAIAPTTPGLSMAKDVVLRFLPPPGEDAQTCGPGPFSMSNEGDGARHDESGRLRPVEFKRVDAPVLVGKDVADAMDFQLAIGPAGECSAKRAPRSRAQTRSDRAAALAEQSPQKMSPTACYGKLILGDQRRQSRLSKKQTPRSSRPPRGSLRTEATYAPSVSAVVVRRH